jgi:hypothetical protein
MLKMIAKAIVPPPVRRRIRHHFYNQFTAEATAARQAAVDETPKVVLEARHIANSRLLPSRRDLLAPLPKGGVIAELGVNEGDFSAQILEICQPRELHLVDIWGSDRYHGGLFERVTRRFQPQIDAGVVHIHRMLSLEAADRFEDETFDMVYIDTVHDYVNTRDELRSYAPKVKSDGLLAGHDYSMGNWVAAWRYGVIEAVHEFVRDHSWEIAALTVNYPEGPSFALRRGG